ncbi:MAG: DNA recombination/repair protein RecA [Novosphingobium sp.]|nr:DNA recombination/repair protein RecA [Novosphingobium sp.]
MAKQPIKKKSTTDLKSLTLAEKLAKVNNFKRENDLEQVDKKPQRYLEISEAFEKETGVAGIPLNTVSCVKGHTNVGKSTFMFEVIKSCQRNGILPVIFDLENAIKWNHAREIGVEVNEIVDEETGEIGYKPADNVMYYDTVTLYNKYGLYDHENNKYLTKHNRDVYVIEDVALCIRELIKKQREGVLPIDMMFIIDSIGVGDCYKAAVKNGSNNMWYAGALSSAFNVIGNDLIPSTLNVTSEYNNSMFYVNKVWTAMTPTGLPSAKEKGGSSFTYFTRLSIFLGNQGSSGVRKLSFTYNGVDYNYATKVKIKIDKNHITNIEREGEICSTKEGLISVSDIEEYKTRYRKFLIERLKKETGKEVKEEDFLEKEEEINN